MPSELDKDFEHYTKKINVNRTWAQKKYNALSEDAKRCLDDYINNQFWLKNGLPLGFEIKKNNSDYARLREDWLQIRDKAIKIGETEKRNWDEWAKAINESEKAAKKESRRFFSKDVKVPKSMTPSYTYKSKNLASIFGRSGYIDGKEFKSIVEKALDTPSSSSDKMKYASNIVGKLSDDILDGLLKDPYGFEGCVRLSLILVTNSNEKLQNEAFRILRKVPSVSQNNLNNEGILWFKSGKLFYDGVQKESKLSKSDAALNFAKELIKEKQYLVNARNDLDGLKAVVQIYGNLKTSSYGGKKKIEAEKLAKTISEALVPGSTERKYSAYGIFERYGYGKGLYGHIQNELRPIWKHTKNSPLPQKLYTDYLGDTLNKKFAISFLENTSDKDLLRIGKNPDGRKALSLLYHALTYSSNSKASEHTNRIMATLSYLDAKQFVGKIVNKEKIPLIPTSAAMFRGILPFAYLNKDGNILLNIGYLSSLNEKYKKEISTLPDSVSTMDGAMFKPDQLIGIVNYDQGGIVMYRPAIYLLQMNKKSLEAVSDKIWTSVELGVSIGTLGVGLAPSILEKAAEITTIALTAINIAVKEYQGWIISNYKEKGKEFINLVDAVTFCANIAMMGEVVVSPLLTKLINSWDELKNINPALTASKEFKAINSDVDKLSKNLRKIDEVPNADIRVSRRRNASQERAPVQRTNKGVDEESRFFGRRDVPNTEATVPSSTNKNLSLTMKKNLVKDDKLTTLFVHEVGANELHKDYMFHTPETGKSIPYDHDSDKDFKFLYGLSEAAQSNDRNEIIKAAKKHSVKHEDGGHHASYTDTNNCTEKAYDQWSNVVRLPMIRDRWITPGDIAMSDTVAEFIRRYDNKKFYPGPDKYKTPEAKVKTDQKWKEAREYTLDYIRKKFNINPDTTTMEKYMALLETMGDKIGRPEIDRIRRELRLSEEMASNTPRREFPSPLNENVSPDTRLVNDTKPDIDDTLPGAQKDTIPISPKRGSSPNEDVPPGTKLVNDTQQDIGDTLPGLPGEPHYSRINIRTLGDECTNMVKQLNMSEQDLNDYLFIHEKASRIDGDWKEGAFQKVVQAEIKKTYETLGPQLGKEMISFGHNPHSISNAIDQLKDSGYDNKAIQKVFKVENKLAESLQSMLNGSRQDARSAIRGSDGDVTKAIENQKWKQLVNSWNKEHSSSMRQMTLSEKQQIQKEAENFAKTEEKIAKNKVKNEFTDESKLKNREPDELKESQNQFKEKVGR
ncbi:hypothetical protein [Methanococcoides sp. LMO-2]|uniref:Uncharacterized protein n=1 Tax=Methanococcoides cohabitans TaxID=3136559 RepID=A0ABU9KQ09_9EURY